MCLERCLCEFLSCFHSSKGFIELDHESFERDGYLACVCVLLVAEIVDLGKFQAASKFMAEPSRTCPSMKH